MNTVLVFNARFDGWLLCCWLAASASAFPCSRCLVTPAAAPASSRSAVVNSSLRVRQLVDGFGKCQRFQRGSDQLLATRRIPASGGASLVAGFLAA